MKRFSKKGSKDASNNEIEWRVKRCIQQPSSDDDDNDLPSYMSRTISRKVATDVLPKKTVRFAKSEDENTDDKEPMCDFDRVMKWRIEQEKKTGILPPVRTYAFGCHPDDERMKMRYAYNDYDESDYSDRNFSDSDDSGGYNVDYHIQRMNLLCRHVKTSFTNALSNNDTDAGSVNAYNDHTEIKDINGRVIEIPDEKNNLPSVVNQNMNAAIASISEKYKDIVVSDSDDDY